MSTQWHPLFAHLLRLLLEEYYRVEPEVAVGDLPRRTDVLVVRKAGSAEPPFRELWNYFTDWNILELKGPEESAEDVHLLRLLHVGTGLAYRYAEERQKDGLPPLDWRQVSFWYLVPTVGREFLYRFQSRAELNAEGNGLWTGRVFGFPMRVVAYRDLPASPDGIPLALLGRRPPSREMSDVILSEDYRERFAGWLQTRFPQLWRELTSMTKLKDRPDLELMLKYADIPGLIEGLTPAELDQVFGKERAAEWAYRHLTAAELEEMLRRKKQEEEQGT